MALADVLQAIERAGDEEAAALLAQADASAAAALERARAEADRVLAEVTASRDDEAAARARGVLAVARLEAGRRLAGVREALVRRALDATREALVAVRERADYPATLGLLIAEARAALPEARRLRVDPRDAALARGLAPDLEVVADLPTWGGAALETDDGRAAPNTLEERLRHLEPLLRARAIVALRAP